MMQVIRKMQTTIQPPQPAEVARTGRRGDAALSALRTHWPEYLMEAALLASFMLSACVFGALLEHPSSPLHQAIEDVTTRQLLAGLAMGCTLVGLVYSPWGQRSGAHMNPAVTMSFLALGKISRWDAIFYSILQLAGGIAGVLLAGLLIGAPLQHEAVNYVVTVPGVAGQATAFAAELLISLLMMSTILIVSNTRRLARFTGLFAGALVALYITVESPFSGMSMNPARTLGSALSASEWRGIWIYFTAPPIAMLLAGQLYRLGGKRCPVLCAKLHHDNDKRCIFRCNYGELDDK
jgi:aquaporin Z